MKNCDKILHAGLEVIQTIRTQAKYGTVTDNGW